LWIVSGNNNLLLAGIGLQDGPYQRQQRWRYAFGDVTPIAALAFAGSSPFSFAGVPIAKNARCRRGGLDLAINKSASLALAYTGQLANDA
jgi:uncharacterized protein with beta-barrel porin domain